MPAAQIFSEKVMNTSVTSMCRLLPPKRWRTKTPFRTLGIVAVWGSSPLLTQKWMCDKVSYAQKRHCNTMWHNECYVHSWMSMPKQPQMCVQLTLSSSECGLITKATWSNFSHNRGKHRLWLHASETQHYHSKLIHAKKKGQWSVPTQPVGRLKC